MKERVNLQSLRSKKARLATTIGTAGQRLFFVAGGASLIIAAILYYAKINGFVFAVAALGFGLVIIAVWHRYDLSCLPPDPSSKTLDGIIDANFLAKLNGPLTPKRVWSAASKTPEGRFVINHLLIDSETILQSLSDDHHDMNIIWFESAKLYNLANPYQLHAGIVVAAIILNSPIANAMLTGQKLRVEDVGQVLNWLERQLDYSRIPRPYFGGIGRDWSSGYTPTLESFSTNLSNYIEHSGGSASFMSHSQQLDSVVTSLSRGNAIALVGEDGVGKSDMVNGLAQRLLEAKDPDLQYYQIVRLNAAHIVSFNGHQLEGIMLTLFGEAVAAGNIILFLDDAELFFGDGVGAFDMSQLLMPLLKSSDVRIIASFTPNGWQQLQAKRPALSNSMTAININEPSEPDIYKIAEDNALAIERSGKVIISYEAIKEAYRLSDQFIQDQAYPKKMMILLEQSLPYADGNAITAESVQTALERTKGIKISAAKEPEANILLNLEDRIHERMINQIQAVGAVAAALRRGRAGVANPKRPIGSFLFLGPTGVGKTELAKSLAAVYFGDEKQIIRLDMSEYQQAQDVQRLLSEGGQTERSLLMSIREQPFSVVLLDEIEKAHPNILNLLLQILDEGQLTDSQNRPASFRNCIIITTSNAGAQQIANQLDSPESHEALERQIIDSIISTGQFKPELVNRFDEIVLFKPLNKPELRKIAKLMMQEVNRTLKTQQITVQLTEEALDMIVQQGYDPVFGARPMRRAVQRLVENTVASKILRREVKAGATIILDVDDLRQ